MCLIMLEARGLTKYYSAITGVRDVNSKSVLGRSWACSGRTARANRPRSGCSRACSSRRAASLERALFLVVDGSAAIVQAAEVVTRPVISTRKDSVAELK